MNFSVSLYYHLPILLFLISLVHGATRYDHWPAIVGAAVRWGVNMLVFLGSVFVVVMAIGWWIRN